MARKHPLRRYREKAGLSQEALGAQIGVTGMTVYRWEAGKRLPRREHWPKIKALTNITPVEMFKFAKPEEAA